MRLVEILEARRLLSSGGDIDPTFGTNGLVSDPFIWSVGPPSIVADGNDRFLLLTAAGLRETNADGSPVASFGQQDGVAFQDILPRGVFVQDDGKILLWGFLGDFDASQTLQRLNADGGRDPSFGEQGSMSVETLGMSIIDSVLVQSTGKIVVLGASADHDAKLLKRLNDDGSLDPTFQAADVAIPNDPAVGLARQSDDKLLIGGDLTAEQESVGMVRLNSDGTRDLSFGDSGVVSQTSAGKPVEFALIPGGSDAFVALDKEGIVRRFSGDGLADSTFVAQANLPADPSPHILPAPGGKWLVYNRFGMTRLQPDGTRDATFGRVYGDFSSPNFDGAAFDSGGNILIASSQIPTSIDQKGVYRLLGAAGPGNSPIEFSASTLTINGSNDGDDIMVSTASVSGGSAILAHITGQIGRLFEPDELQHIVVLAQDGNDLVRIRVDVPASISGGEGSDTLGGGDANDSLSGNAGPDFLDGGNGNDRLAGNGGKDIIGGGVGDDFILGGAGKDRMAGEGGNDLLEGGSGDDFLLGGAGLDTFAGGAGDDRFIGEDGLAESIFGDAGNDLAVPNELDILSSIEGELPRG